jgi:hypothetical protein
MCDRYPTLLQSVLLKGRQTNLARKKDILRFSIIQSEAKTPQIRVM